MAVASRVSSTHAFLKKLNIEGFIKLEYRLEMGFMLKYMYLIMNPIN